jgi:DNA-binding MltR family transcriptional regulator
MSNLNDSLNGKSYVVMYDLGVIKEARGNFDEAKKLYDFADDTSLKPIDEINSAVIRINKLIDERNQARAQIKKS